MTINLTASMIAQAFAVEQYELHSIEVTDYVLRPELVIATAKVFGPRKLTRTGAIQTTDVRIIASAEGFLAWGPADQADDVEAAFTLQRGNGIAGFTTRTVPTGWR